MEHLRNLENRGVVLLFSLGGLDLYPEGGRPTTLGDEPDGLFARDQNRH